MTILRNHNERQKDRLECHVVVMNSSKKRYFGMQVLTSLAVNIRLKIFFWQLLLSPFKIVLIFSWPFINTMRLLISFASSHICPSFLTHWEFFNITTLPIIDISTFCTTPIVIEIRWKFQKVSHAWWYYIQLQNPIGYKTTCNLRWSYFSVFRKENVWPL